MKKELPTPEFDPGYLLNLPYEALKWEILKSAIELKVFDLLSEPANAAKVSDVLSIHPINTEFFLNALVAIGCLTKTNGEFKNTKLAECYLTGSKDTSLGGSLLFMSGWITPVLNGGVMNLLRNGPCPSKDIASDELWEKGARASINHTRCGRAQIIARYVSELPEFPAFSKILDLGAGPGVIGIAVTSAHSSLKCIIYDQPAVCNVAGEVIAEYGMEDRVTTECGNYMEDDFGKGFDFIMANFTLNFYRDHLGVIVRKVHDALKPGGIFMVTSDGVNKDGTAPAASIISWLPTSLQGNDMSFKKGMIARSMLDAGFVSTERQTLTDINLESHGPVEMTIGRKNKNVLGENDE